MPRKRRKSGKSTVFDVAKAAGVSAITVSRALHTPDRVSEATRKKVEAAVRKLDYRPDPAARSLATDRSNIVGVLVPSVTNTVFTDTLRGIFDVADDSEFQIQIGSTRYSRDKEERLLALFLSQRPAGLIIAGIDQSEKALERMAEATCPLVQITEIGPRPVDMMVGFSHADAARTAARHLIDKGYRRIGFLGARRDPRSTRRLAGFRSVLEAEGLFDADRVLFSDTPSSVSLGAAQLAELLSRDPAADAVLCNNDDLALGVLFECQRRDIAIPDAFGICGFNDLDVMAFHAVLAESP